MIVVSDTSPISNLLVIGRLNLLQQLFEKVVVPECVYKEILQLEDFAVDVTLFKNATWIQKMPIQNALLFEQLLLKLDSGEAEAIVLAKDFNAEYLLIDERKGKIEAERLGVHTIGLLGILLEAKRRGIIIHVKEVIEDLTIKAGFWVDKKIVDKVLALAGEI